MKLNFSNLKTVTQASLGTVVLLIILIVILTVSYIKLQDVENVTNRIAELRTPTLHASSELKNNINTALANLRGWMLLEDNKFIIDRKLAWKNIRKAQRELDRLSGSWTNPENVTRLNEVHNLLDKFEASQDKVEHLVWDEKNLPATYLLFTQAIPRADIVFQQITKLMAVEQYVATTPERKKLFATMANFRGSFAIGLAHIRAFLISADPVYIEKFNASWQENRDAFTVIQKYQELFDEGQLKNFEIMVDARNKFSPLPEEIFKLRSEETWNLANYELKNVAAKHGQQLVGLLEDMTQDQNRLLAIDTQENETSLAEFIQILMWLFLLAVATTLAVSFYMKRKVSDPLNAAINDALVLADNVASGKYNSDTDTDTDTDTDKAIHSSSYEATLLLNSLKGMASDVKKQAKELTQAKDAAEFAVQKVEIARDDLSAQKNAMDQHSLVSITDIKGIITYANDKFCEISGYSKEELLGQNHSLLNSGNEPENYWREMYLNVSKGNVWHDEVKNKAKDGHFYWVDTTIVPMYENNKLIGYTSIRTDITTAKELEQNLIEAKNQAEVANESKTDFLANMSHEIRTPMNGVIGMTNLLIDSDLNSDQYKLAKTVKASAESLLFIINDILDFSKVEAGKLELEDIDFNLGSMVEDLGTAMHYLAEDKGLELICPANSIQNQWLNADPGRIRQILTNLIGNAIKFTEQGEVAVFCKITNKADNRRLIRFEIKDTGIGISEEHQDKLFSKFTQADSSTTRKYGGTGLGLSICQKLVDLMDGDIGIESELGKGTTFWFTLDLEGAKPENEIPLPLADLQKQKIMAVDDNATNRDLLDQLLTHWGIEHQLVANGMDAIQVLQECDDSSPYTIGLLDMHMPDMDGAQLCKHIKNDAAISDTKLVLLSSQAQRGDAKKMHAIGFDGYLPKPIHQSELYNVLQHVAGISSDDDILITRYTDKEQMQFKSHLLVVEDNITNQQVIKGMLEKFGITIDLASNGEEALAALQQGTDYSLVFMDCQMPVMDGYSATKKIRDPVTKNINHAIPVIAMTANVMRGDREKCLAAGMNDYVAKPVDPAKLRRMLNHWLPNTTIATSKSDEESIILNDPEPNDEQSETLIFDYDVMNSMLMGDKELMSTISETFLDDVAAQIKQLKSILDSDDVEQAAAISHKIKGASGNVGGKVLSASALEIEMAGKAGDMETVRQGVEQLESDFTALKDEMQRKLA